MFLALAIVTAVVVAANAVLAVRWWSKDRSRAWDKLGLATASLLLFADSIARNFGI